MKRRLTLALAVALTLVLILSSAALAWDNEDTCVADNEDFIAGGGFDDGASEFHSGAQDWPYGKAPNEGYSLYRDDVTDTGNLDSASILTFTPDGVDLPIITEYWHPDTGTYWYMGDESPDTWYWETEPRGYNNPQERKTYLKIVLPDAKTKYLTRGTSRYQDIDFNDGTWRIQIPAKLHIWNGVGSGAAEYVAVDSGGNITNDIDLTGLGEIVITKM